MVPEKQYSRDSKMKINELLRTNERFNLNQAQVARNCCCVHTPTRTSLKDLFFPPSPFLTPLARLAFGIYSRFSRGCRVTGLCRWERVVFQSFHWLWITWEKTAGILCGSPPFPTLTHTLLRHRYHM